jgi:hypothetical protein
MGDAFALPARYADMKPFIDVFVGDAKLWRDFVVSVRNALIYKAPARLEVQELFRTIDIRITQRERRERLARAVAAALDKHLIVDDYKVKTEYANLLTRDWLRRKETLLRSHREGGKQRLTVDYRRTLLDEFWAKIDAEIEKGELPKP